MKGEKNPLWYRGYLYAFNLPLNVNAAERKRSNEKFQTGLYAHGRLFMVSFGRRYGLGLDIRGNKDG